MEKPDATSAPTVGRIQVCQKTDHPGIDDHLLHLLHGGFFIQTLGIARPRMAADLNGMALYSWSIAIPSSAAAFGTLLLGKFSDMYGRRTMLLISMVLF
jgi:MFS family permease